MAGTGQCCEPSCCLRGKRGGAAHLVGRNLNLPEATGNGPGLDWGGAIPFKAEADTLGHRRIEPARLEANSPAGHKQVPAVMYSSGKPGCCRLSLAARQMDCINAHPSSQARVNETMEPWTKSLARKTH